MRSPRLALGVTLLALALPADAQLRDELQMAIAGSYVTNAFGPESEVDVQATTLRLTTGDALQFSVDLSFLRVRSPNQVLGSGLGPIPVDPRRRGAGGASNPGPGPGPGTGSSGTPAVPPSNPEVVQEWASGLGDLWLGVARQVAGGDSKVYRANLELEAKVPIADEEKNLGTGELDLRLGVAAEYDFLSVGVFGGLGYNRLGDPSWIELEDVFDVFAGLESEPFAESLILFAWLQGNEAVVAGTDSRALAGVGLRSVGKLRWKALLSAGLSGSSADFGVSVGVSYGFDAAPRRPRG